MNATLVWCEITGHPGDFLYLPSFSTLDIKVSVQPFDTNTHLHDYASPCISLHVSVLCIHDTFNLVKVGSRVSGDLPAKHK